jgi:glyoxylase-like metal-dependent hydrolase (beta-lactamase superfamily II)
MAEWRQILPGVLMWPDSCNVYAIAGPEGTLIVDAGTGEWIDHVAELPARPVALACTHFFRDHCAGAVRAARELGLRVLVPEREAELFRDPLEHFRGRKTYIVYVNYWDHFAPIEPIPVAGILRDYERLSVAGLYIEVVPLPGASMNQVGIAFDVPGTSLRAVCSGETIHSPGRVPRVAPLQYNYADLLGAVEVWHSASELRRRQPDALLPSLGSPILTDVDQALEALQRSMEALCATRPIEAGEIEAVKASAERPVLTQLSERVWLTQHSASSCVFLAGPGGSALALDYGYHAQRWWHGFPFDTYRSRVLAHTLEALQDEAGIEHIDAVIPSHYHDDHVAGIPFLQRSQGTECWAHEVFADLLERPEAHQFPCDNPIATRVHRRLRDEQAISWEGIDLRFHAASGHTRFEALISFEVDGLRYAHSGDQYGFIPASAFETRTVEAIKGETISDWSEVRHQENHVYRGGAHLDSFARSAAWLKALRPDVVLSGHWAPFRANEGFFELLDERTEIYERVHRCAMPLADDDTHFDVDSWGGWLWPYRLHLAEGERAAIRATVRNPLPHEASLEVRLVVPDDWTGDAATLSAAARAEVSCELGLTVRGACRRQPIAVELVADGRPFGQVAEALVTVGGEAW